jgi:hypothetical protein
LRRSWNCDAGKRQRGEQCAKHVASPFRLCFAANDSVAASRSQSRRWQNADRDLGIAVASLTTNGRHPPVSDRTRPRGLPRARHEHLAEHVVPFLALAKGTFSVVEDHVDTLVDEPL